MRRRYAGASPSLLRALSCSLAAPTYGPEVFRDVHALIERASVAATFSLPVPPRPPLPPRRPRYRAS
jgi:hypothetical protein